MPTPDSANRLTEILATVREATAIRTAPAQAAPNSESVFVANQVERITFHDFALYETVLDPWVTRDPRQEIPADDPAPLGPPQETAPPPPNYLPADLVDLDHSPRMPKPRFLISSTPKCAKRSKAALNSIPHRSSA